MKTDQFINLIVLLNFSVYAENYGEPMHLDSYGVLIKYNFVTQSRNKKHNLMKSMISKHLIINIYFSS